MLISPPGLVDADQAAVQGALLALRMFLLGIKIEREKALEEQTKRHLGMGPRDGFVLRKWRRISTHIICKNKSLHLPVLIEM